MEYIVTVNMVVNLQDSFGGRICVKEIVSNDNSTMRAKLYHKANNDKSQLIEEISKPSFLYDPGHCIKAMAKAILIVWLHLKQ